MKTFITILLSTQFMLMMSHTLFSQDQADLREFGITAGGFTNFPGNQNYLKKGMNAIYLAPYVRTGKHEFSAGIIYPLTTKGIFYSDDNINSRLGVLASYNFYIFNVYGRENLFVHYSFQYLRFVGHYIKYYTQNNQPYNWTETNTYINNVIGIGYNLFLDMDERFGFYYTFDYIISQAGYKLGTEGLSEDSWVTKYIWNNLSTHLGFSFKLTSLHRKDKK